MAVYFLKPSVQSPPCDSESAVKRHRNRNVLPCFSLCVLTGTKGHLPLSNPFKLGSNWPVSYFDLWQNLTCSIDITGVIRRFNSLRTPANFSMLMKIARGFPVAFVKEATDVPSIFALAPPSCTFKDMGSTVRNILDTGHLFEEHINGWGPFINKMFWWHISIFSQTNNRNELSSASSLSSGPSISSSTSMVGSGGGGWSSSPARNSSSLPSAASRIFRRLQGGTERTEPSSSNTSSISTNNDQVWEEPAGGLIAGTDFVNTFTGANFSDRKSVV